jgi:polysaccharide biosynthesis protein VpsM
MKSFILTSVAFMFFVPCTLWAGDAPLNDNAVLNAGDRGIYASQPSEAIIAAQLIERQPAQQYAAAAEVPKPEPSSGSQSQQPAAAGEAPPMGQPSGGAVGGGELSGDVLERKSNIAHPFLAVGGYFTDNVRNAHDNKKSDFGAIISPGIYFALPGLRERIRPVDTVNIAPGGANLTGFRPEYPRQLQAYLYYRADIETFVNNDDLNAVSHLAEAAVQYNMRGGLRIDVGDQFALTHNQRGTGFSYGLDKYYANLASVAANYQISEKTSIRADYSNYYVQFLADENKFRDRDDNRASVYFFYKLWPKTALFVQYEYLNTAYREKTVSGSSEHHGFFGVKYDLTDKTKAMVKVGYGIKEFDNSVLSSKSNIYAEAQLNHKFSDKTSLILTAARRTDETDVAQAYSIVETTGDAALLYRFTTKLTGNLSFRYTDEQYNGAVTYGGETKELHDQYIKAGASLLYEYRDWLSFTVGYFFTDRISNINPLSYTNNTVFFRISAIY